MTPSAVKPWANLRIPAADGTSLAADIHLPAGDTPVPVVVTRTPYGRSKHHAEGRGWARHGFGYVVADVRGRYDSDGIWSPYSGERADGAALADWILAQPWSDGRLIPYGGSYSGFTAWCLAVERPGVVRAVVSLGPSMSLARTKFDPSGVLRLAEHAAWWLERADSRTSRDGLSALVFGDQPDLLHHLPVAELARELGADLPGWTAVVDAGPADDGPEHLTEADLAAVDAACLHVGGWYDLLLPETLRHWEIVGSAHDPRPPRRLIVGAWEHDLAFTTTTAVGGREHGPDSRMRFGKTCVDWLRDVLGPAPSPSWAEVFDLGTNRWSVGGDWPGKTTSVLLHTRPDGTLSTEPSTGTATRRFEHDPADPFPGLPPATDRRILLDRADAVRAAGEPLPEPVTIRGAAVVALQATSDAPTVDWTVRLLEQVPGGPLLDLCTGTVHAPGSTAEHRVTLTDVAVTVPSGSRLVLEVTAADFPTLARNLGTGQNRYHSTEIRRSTNAVVLGATTVRLPLAEDPR